MITVYGGRQYRKIIKKVFNFTVRHFGLKKICAELSFVNDDTMREINARTRNEDSITDVLSFPAEENFLARYKNKEINFKNPFNPNKTKIYLGEIVIDEAVLLKQAQDMNIPPQKRCAQLTLHSLLHLLGYDHYDEEEKISMWNKEEEILKSLNCDDISREKYV